MTLLPLVIAIAMLPSLARAQDLRNAVPSRKATIVKYDTVEDGPLRVTYSDGAVIEIPRERSAVRSSNDPLTQVAFSDVQIARDGQRIGWLAEYMICAQSYPCPIALVVFRNGEKPRSFSGRNGIVWDWTFLANGRQVALHCGFPHGDSDGYYLLFDFNREKPVGSFYPNENATPPSWVKEMRALGKR